jgi:hypothetical protein
MSRVPKHPKRSAADYVQGITKAAASSVPVVGGPAAELLGLVYGPPLEKRREKWMDELADVVNELQQKVENITPESLSQNESFISMSLRATEIAMRNHQKDKLAALRNAVLNAGLKIGIDETIQQIFLNHIDALTPSHLKVLKFFRNPVAWAHSHGIHYPNWTMGAPSTVLEIGIPELSGRRPFYDQLIADLNQRGLLSDSGIHTMMTGQGMLQSRTTDLGDSFIEFISDPA